MRIKQISLTFLITILLLDPASGQFDKFKKKAGKLVKNPAKFLKDEAVTKLSEARSEFDSTNFNYAVALSDNASLFESKEKSERYKNLGLNLLKSSDEKTAEEKANGYLDAGEFLYATNQFRAAEISFFTSKTIFESEGLTNHINYPRVISNIGLLYHTMGRFTKSEEFTLQALEMRKELLGTDHSSYGASLNNLSVLEKDMGKYNQSEKDIRNAIKIIKDTDGEESMPYAIALNNQAKLYQTMGRFEQAEPLMNKAVDISAENINEKSGNHQRLLTNQALLYQDMGNYDKAEEIYLHVIDLKEKRFGKKHPDYAHMLNNLAALYVLMGKDDEVEDLLKKSASIYEKKFGKDHPSYARTLNNLGNFYRYKQQYEDAESNLTESLEIREIVLGNTHPDYVSGKEDLAILYWQTDRMEKASEYYSEVLNQSLEFIKNYFAPLSEVEKTKYWDQLRPSFQRFYNFSIHANIKEPSILRDMYNYHLSTKALLLNATSRIREEILNSDDEELIKEYTTWLDQKEMLARYYTYSKEQLREEKVNLDSLENEANSKEKWLSEQSDLFNKGYQTSTVKLKDIKELLNDNEAAVEIIQVKEYKNDFTGNHQYAALIITNEMEYPELVVMNNGNQLETRYYSYYRNAIKQKLQDEYSYAQYWEKISNEIDKADHLFLSLDGIYNQINLNTLRNPDGAFLLEYNDLTILSSTRDLVHFKETVESRKLVEASLVGYPDYGNPQKISPLPGTRKEVQTINNLLKTNAITSNIYLEAEATEQKVKNLDNPSLLHIATHGFFMEDIEKTEENVFGVEPDHAKENPLLRAGLMFTGAANAIDGLNTKELSGNDNGILTAYEAMNLALDQTQLVVLSACETGLGDVKAGEGVYGLQRAFLVAGADAMIMSLWKVNDEATQDLMTTFYKEWLQGKNIIQAFKSAQLSLKSKYKDPYFWGAFILVNG